MSNYIHKDTVGTAARRLGVTPYRMQLLLLTGEIPYEVSLVNPGPKEFREILLDPGDVDCYCRTRRP